MEENDVELIDYLIVIWKRKIVIIVGILLCMAVGGGVSQTKFQDIYRAETLIQVGKVLSSFSYSSTATQSILFSSSPTFKLIDTPKSLQSYIPIIYSLGVPGYSLEVISISGTSILRIIVEGSNGERVEELLKGVVDGIIENHREKLEYSIEPYSVLMANREGELTSAQNDIYLLETSLKGMTASNVGLVTIVQTQNNLWLMRNNLRLFRQQQLEYNTAIDRLKDNSSKVLSTTEASKSIVRSKIGRNILIGGAVGLMISICVAFIIEYLRMAMKKVRGKVNR